MILVHLLIERRVERIADCYLPVVPVHAVSHYVGVTCAEGRLHFTRQAMQSERAGRAPTVRRSPDSFVQHQRQPADKQHPLIHSYSPRCPFQQRCHALAHRDLTEAAEAGPKQSIHADSLLHMHLPTHERYSEARL